jgi:serine phosphatase RsbU (regulator of sigma subunit)
LLAAVNVPLVLFVAVLAVLDHRMEMKRATSERSEALDEQASLIGSALLAMDQPPNSQTIQRLLVGSRLDSSQQNGSPRWINIGWNEQDLQYYADTNVNLLADSESEHARKSWENSDEFAVVGHFAAGPVRVEISERAGDVRRAIRREIIIHVLSLLGLATIATVLVNLALVRLIVKPTRLLVNAVQRISEDRLAVPRIKCLSRELNTLGQSIAEMSESLANTEQRRALDMSRAERIQRHLLPQSPTVPGLTISTHYQPAEDVAGDIYGVVAMPDDIWLIYITDLVGHGIPAAMNASILKMLFDTASMRGGSPGEVLQRVNVMLPGYLMDSEFATAAVLRWDPATGRLQLASAGHEPVTLLSKDGTSSLESTGLPLGIDTDSRWKTTEHWLQKGDRLLMATDGVAESHNVNEQQFGRGRIAEIFAGSVNEPLDDSLNRLVGELGQHAGNLPPDDDVTILALECNSVGGQRLEVSHPNHLRIVREAVA